MTSPIPIHVHGPISADLLPIYILLIFVPLLNVYFFFIGTVCTRIWFYKGSLGPEPEKFLILHKELKDRCRKSLLSPGTAVSEQDDTGTTTRRLNIRGTMFRTPVQRH
ncbi:predicted protein [Plenodomus lingam JN3]|uniref:Uncharacterized protein n=1 Tax=Leptosphaeria maculans (strain JN3 / isolate v23.1.3 / race Av1-4-5-6-7-8) TaxID=985895 RepID=E5A7F2_LEPMJ|nr:predicted protein [Plenodomus lingam JN3]CBX99547.1 predicted protein [Plenodomus lingam JN3]